MKYLNLTLLVLSAFVGQYVYSQQTCFSSANDNVFEGVGNSRCITKGDYDNDGDLDVVMGNYTGTPDPTLQRLYFIENDGSASFSAPVSLESGSQPLDVQSADLDNDGNLDLVVVNFNIQRMAVMIGNGDGTFQTPVGYASDFGPNKITLRDYNNDGFTDVAITTNSNTVNVFLNDNSTPGTYLPFTSIPLAGGSNPAGIFAGDVDQDGNVDLVTANNGTGNSSVLIGDGTGSFSAPIDYITGVGCSAVVLGDMNNDTFLDILTTNEDDNEISILLNDGAGNYLSEISYAVGSGPIALQVDDFDNNLNLDVVAVNAQDNTLSVLTGNGDGTVQPQDVVGAINSPRNIITGDFNNDTFSDIVISCLVGQVMPIYLGDGTANFNSGGNFFGVGGEPVSLYSGDFNADGNKDFASLNNLDNNLTIHDGDGSGTSFVLSATLPSGNNPTFVIGADLDNNSFEDLIVSNYADNNISVFMNTAGTFGAPTTYNANAAPLQVKTGDINFDGNPDIVVLNEGNSFSVLIGNGAGGFAAPVSYATGNAPLGIDVGDANLDNFDDIVVANSGDNNIGIYTNDGTGLFGAPLTRNVGNGPNSVSFGDLNNDGAPEVVTTNYSSNNISVTVNNGSGLFGFISTSYTSNDTGPANAVIDDFDGDGNNDVAVANLVSIASTGNVAVFVGDGANSLTFDQIYAVGMVPNQVITDDFNNDGLPDLGAVNNVSETVSILLNTGGAPTITALGPITFCNGGSVVLESTPSGSYLWSNGETTQSITVTTSGTYDVSTSSGIGGWCSSVSNQITVTVNTGPTLSYVGDTNICVGEPTTLTVSGATTYTWSGGLGTGSTKTVSPGTTTTYTVTGDDGSTCTTNLDITVVVNPLPDATFTGLGALYCETSTGVTMTPTTAGGTFSGPGITSNQFDPSTAGIGTHTITYTITDANGCSNSSSQIVDVVSSTVDSDYSGLNPTYCVDGAITTLVPVETGGTFSGPGISGSDFDPSVAGVGTHTITHEISSGGCTSSTSYTTEVFALPDAGFTGLDPTYCIDGAAATLTPNLTGGTFSGPGISGSDFNPAVAGIGTHTVLYTVTDGSGCTNSSSQTVEVFDIPDASFAGLDPSYCIDAAIATLTPTQVGGTFSGSGISGNDFDPASAGVGVHTISYTVTDGNGCSNISSQSVEVFDLPDATFTGLDPTYCESAPIVTLTPSQSGGVFSGPGISGNDFDPITAGIGTHTITYSITDGNGCSNSLNQTVDVISSTIDSDYSGLNLTYCEDGAISTLVPVEAGGTFSGPGISGSDFDPSVAGVGTHTITHEISSGGCTSSTSYTADVFALPDADFTGLNPAYCIDAALVTLNPTVTGGTFSGPGITGDDFDPASAGVGTHTINYTVTDVNGCSNSSTQNVVVDDQYPDASFSGLDPQYCLNNGVVTLTPTETGGTFSGPGITGSDFDPNTAGLGVHTITYNFTSTNGCSSSSSQSVEVLIIPDADFVGLDPTYCVDASAVTLTPNVTGGTFSGPGITGSDFDPVLAGVGTHTISYSVSGGNGCVNTSNQVVEVVALPDATITGLNPAYCIDAAAVTLIPVETGGTFSGPGITGSDFDPGAAGLGIHTVTYTITDVNGCFNSSTQTVEVDDELLDAAFSGLATQYCESNGAVTLIPNETGGTFSGPGISGNTFDPSTAGAGTHTITYTITGVFACSNSSSKTVEVLESLDPTFTGLDPEYCVNDAITTLTAVVQGGSFSGPGTSLNSNTFNPSLAGAGTHTITHTQYNTNGCISSSSQVVVVHDVLDASFIGLESSYCSAEESDTLVPSVSGGTFSGVQTGAVFNPGLASIGVNTVTYTIVNAQGCSSMTTQSTEVIDTPNSSFSRDGLTLTAFASGPGITYEWYSCSGDSLIPGATDQVFEVIENGSYALIVNNGGCKDTSNCELIDDVGLSQDEKSYVVIYPNPNNGKFNIELSSVSELKIYDAVGKLIFANKLQAGINVLDIKTKVETGIYLVEITSDNGSKSIHNVVVRK